MTLTKKGKEYAAVLGIACLVLSLPVMGANQWGWVLLLWVAGGMLLLPAVSVA